MLQELVRSRFMLGVAVCAVLLATAAVALASVSAVRPVPRAEPGEVLFGAHLDWGSASAGAYAQRLGHSPMVYGAFEDFPLSVRSESLEQIAIDVAAADGTLLLTLEPHGGLETVTDAVLADLTAWLTRWNERGLPIIVRFAHEMNGSWYAWGQQPDAYVATFRRAAAAVRATPSSSILWSPNDGSYYPFPGGPPPRTDRDFALLDTDGDGRITQADDPYAPYYPGAAHVDLVGLSVYHFGHDWPWGDNDVPEDGKFLAKVTGTYDGLGGDHTAVPDFHAVYGVEAGHPMVIAETSALYNDVRQGASDVAIKQAWFDQVFAADLPARLPAVELIMWFEVDKEEQDVPGTTTHWSATGDAAVRAAFQAALPEWIAATPATGPVDSP